MFTIHCHYVINIAIGMAGIPKETYFSHKFVAIATKQLRDGAQTLTLDVAQTGQRFDV